MRLMMLVFALFATPALAQQSAQPAPAKQTAILLTDAEIDIIWGALAEQPWRRVQPVMDKIKEQWKAQQLPPPPVEK